jgi:hypothetical protein
MTIGTLAIKGSLFEQGEIAMLKTSFVSAIDYLNG